MRERRSLRRPLFPLVLVLAMLLAQAGTVLAETTAAQFDPRRSSELQDTLEKAVTRMGVPGAVMVVRAPDGSTWTGVTGVSEIKSEGLTAMNTIGALGSTGVPGARKAAGSDDAERETPRGSSMDPQLKFRIASITKTFTAMLTLLLAQDGTLSLDDTLDHWLPNIVQYSDRITIRQLLNHTAGLYNYTDRRFYQMVCQEPGRAWRPEELVALAREHGPLFEPGKGWKYSNTGYILLGMIIEKATGREYKDVLKNRILEPLGMKDASVPPDDAVDGAFAHGYVYNDGWIDFTRVHPSTAGPAANMISTADLLTWLDALTSGKLLNERFQKEMNTYVATGVNGFTYGLGLMNWRGAVGHNGIFFDAYTSCAYRYKDYMVVVLVNGNAKPGQGIDNAAQSLFWSAVRTLLPEPPPGLKS